MKKQFYIFALLLAGTVAAQQLAFQDPDEQDSGGLVATESEAEPVEGSGEDAQQDGPVADNDTGADSEAGNPDNTGENADIPEVDESELTTEIEDDFEPTEEISEDYPVPLPSDI